MCGWSDNARAAALALSGELEETEGEINTMLLSDIRDILEETKAAVLASTFIAALNGSLTSTTVLGQNGKAAGR